MSKSIHGGKRPKNAREAYVEQLPYGRSITGSMSKKRDTFTNMDPLDNGELAYRSTSNYLRQIAQQGVLTPTEMITARNVPRTKSASEITPRNNVNRSMTGNPRYKAQEDYYDEIQLMKKDMKTIKDENSNLRAKIRRLEEDNTRKRKEIDALYDSSKDGDLRRALSGSTTDRNNNNATTTNVVMSLKQRLFKLELQLKQKEITIDELKSDPRWTKGIEFELQNRALLGELERQKAERLNYIEKNDYEGTIAEEKKNAVRKLTREKDELQQENQSLKRKIHELERLEPGGRLSPRPLGDNDGRKSSKEIEDLKHELNRANKNLQQTQHELDQVQDKLAQANEHIERMKKKKPDEDLEEIKHERDQFREKSNRVNEELDEVKRERDNYKKKLKEANEKLAELERDQEKLVRPREKKPVTYQSGRSSSPPTPPKRSTSPITVKSPKPTYLRSESIKDDNFDIDNENRKSPSADTSNENAVKKVQASLRGHSNRSEINKTPDSSAFRKVPSRDPGPLLHPHPSPSSAAGGDRGGGPRPNIRTDQDKPGPGDRDSPSKSRQPTASPIDNRRSTPTPVDKGGGSRGNLRDDRSKTDPNDRDSPSKLRQSTASPTDNRRSTPIPVDKGGGSRGNLRDDRSKTDPNDRDSPSKLRQSTASPTDNRRSTPIPVDKGGGSRGNLRDDRSKMGPDNRDLSSKQGPSSSPSKNPNPPQSASSGRPARPSSPGASRPLTKKSPTTSKQSLKEIPSEDDDDDLVIAGGFGD